MTGGSPTTSPSWSSAAPWPAGACSALFGGLGAAGLVACAADDSGSTTSDGPQGGGPGGAPPAGGGGDSSVTVADGEIPEETAGPYPGDGSNGVNVLTETGIVRSDITSASAPPPGSPRASR